MFWLGVHSPSFSLSPKLTFDRVLLPPSFFSPYFSYVVCCDVVPIHSFNLVSSTLWLFLFHSPLHCHLDFLILLIFYIFFPRCNLIAIIFPLLFPGMVFSPAVYLSHLFLSFWTIVCWDLKLLMKFSVAFGDRLQWSDSTSPSPKIVIWYALVFFHFFFLFRCTFFSSFAFSFRFFDVRYIWPPSTFYPPF